MTGLSRIHGHLCLQDRTECYLNEDKNVSVQAGNPHHLQLFILPLLLFAPVHRADLAGTQVFKNISVVLSVIHMHHKQCLVQYGV